MSLLKGLVLNGASRHRLGKGFLLRNATGPEKAWNCTRVILETGGRALRAHEELEHFKLDGSEKHPGVVTLVTPWMPVYTFKHREEFCRRMAKAIRILSEAVKPTHHILGLGIEPLAAPDAEKAPDLCADVHQIEVMDEGEIERIYNLFRQYLPELIAITVNSALQNGKIQRDFSQRMRFNTSSFLPRYLSQFSTSRLDQLRRMIRKDYGLGDLRQMDVNPLGDRIDLLDLENRNMLGVSAPAIELRFPDAQCSLPFMRALIVLFQAIAIQGRALTRQGRRVFPLRDSAIDGNKARAIQKGMTAVFQPDPKFSESRNGQSGAWYHECCIPERASSALLSLLECQLLPSLHGLECQWSELAPLVLGLELRRRNRQSLVNYAEYQQFLAYTEPRNLAGVLLEHWETLLMNPSRDLVVEKNSETYPELATEIEAEWLEKLTPQRRSRGSVIWYDWRKGHGEIRSENETFLVEARDLDGIDRLAPRQVITFSTLRRRKRLYAIEVRTEQRPRREGRIIAFKPDKNFGFIVADQDQGKFFFHRSSLAPGARLSGKERVSFEPSQQLDGRWSAVNVQLLDRPGPRSNRPTENLATSQIRGKITSLDPNQRMGIIQTSEGDQVSFALGGMARANDLRIGQRVVCTVCRSPEGLQAVDMVIETVEGNLGD